MKKRKRNDDWRAWTELISHSWRPGSIMKHIHSGGELWGLEDASNQTAHLPNDRRFAAIGPLARLQTLGTMGMDALWHTSNAPAEEAQVRCVWRPFDKRRNFFFFPNGSTLPRLIETTYRIKIGGYLWCSISQWQSVANTASRRDRPVRIFPQSLMAHQPLQNMNTISTGVVVDRWCFLLTRRLVFRSIHSPWKLSLDPVQSMWMICMFIFLWDEE